MAWLSAAVLLTGLLSGCSSSADLSGLLSERNTGVSLFSGKSGTPYTAAAADEYEDICSSGRYTLRFRQGLGVIHGVQDDTGSGRISLRYRSSIIRRVRPPGMGP